MAGNDTVVGSSGGDTIIAFKGSDTLIGVASGDLGNGRTYPCFVFIGCVTEALSLNRFLWGSARRENPTATGRFRARLVLNRERGRPFRLPYTSGGTYVSKTVGVRAI